MTLGFWRSSMKVGDLVRVNPKAIGDYAKTNYPHMTETGILVEWDAYHPVVLYSTGARIMARANMEVVSASR
jgi:hypothetical protein